MHPLLAKSLLPRGFQTLSIGCLLFLAQASSAAPVVSGIQLSIDLDNNVSITSSGNSTFFGNVGSGGNFGLINGWAITSGQVLWTDNNGATVATLNSSGMHVPVGQRVANQNGTKSGSLSLAASTVLGAALRQSLRGGVRPFTSVAAQGSIPFEFSGTATIAKEEVTIVRGLFLEVDSSTFDVTVLFGGDPLVFGDVGDAGSFSLENGWRIETGDLSWRDANSLITASLDRGGFNVPQSGLMADGDIIGSATIDATSSLGFTLVDQFGEGTFNFSSLAAASPTTEFYFEGTVIIVPEPSSTLLGLTGLGLLSILRPVRRASDATVE